LFFFIHHNLAAICDQYLMTGSINFISFPTKKNLSASLFNIVSTFLLPNS